MTRAYNTATTQQNSGGAVAGVTAGKNAIINGGMDIWQRGTSSAISSSIGGSWGGDRFLAYRAVTGATVSQNSSTGLDGFKNAMRMQRNSGNTSTSGITAIQNVETSMAIPYAGKTVTLSFWARKGADFSATSSAVAVYLWTGTGTDQAWYAYTGQATAIATSATLTTSWQRFSFTATLGSTVTEFATEFLFNPTGTAGTNDWWEFTGVQLEVGSVATPFSRAGGTIQGELAACQRYYQIAGDTIYEIMDGGYMTSGSVAYPSWIFSVPMRTTPTGTVVGSWAILNVGQPVLQASQQRGFCLRATSGTTGSYYFHSNTTYYLTFSAEL